jgi:ubiquinone/menaquinone biosynthesis C-methylase UbiE
VRVLDLADRMGIQSGDQVLDLGAGIGGPGRDIVAHTGCHMHGVTLSSKQIENLRRISEEQGSPYMDVWVGDMQELAAPDASFDHVMSINAVYHAGDPEAVISEAGRVVRSGGRFGVDDWFTTAHTTPVTHAALRWKWSTESKGFHNFDEFVSTMRHRGFRIVESIDYTAEAGAFLCEQRFGSIYDEQAAPVLLMAFPRLYGGEFKHALQAVRDLRADILYMGKLYRNGQAVYRQVIGEKAGAT